MIHARTDYDRIQDPAVADPSLLSPGSSPIGEDEPVMLFRAKDKLAPTVLLHYALLLEQDGAADHMVRAVRLHASRMLAWQRELGSKTPDMPADAVRS